jgi:hypothetical protein
MPADGERTPVLRKVRILSTDQPKYQDVEAKFEKIDLRLIPGLFPKIE